MKIKNKILAVLLITAMCIGITAISPFAAEKEVAPLGAPTGLEAIGAQPMNATLDASADELPKVYNSADYGWVLPVRQQQNNTCWAFGTLSTFETLLLKNGEIVETFAPQHANLWGIKRADGTGWQRNGESSGYSYIPMGYLTSRSGPLYEKDFPTHFGITDFKNSTLTPDYALTEAIFFNNKSSDESIKELILTYGAVVGNFNADQRYLSMGTSFYCADHSYKASELLGHCVSVVGWNDNYPKENFMQSLSGTPSADGAWIIKNSWGSNNGDNGYFYISYEDVWIFDTIFGNSYALTGYQKINESIGIYQNEVDGATYECNYFTSQVKPYDTITYMNVFEFDENHRTLDKVIFETTSKGADYTVYYIPVDTDAPTSNTERWAELYTGTVENPGYICADIDATLLPEGKGAIGIQIDNERAYLENNATTNSIGVCEWLSTGGRFIFKPQSEFGMSYFMKNGRVRDLMEFYANDFGDPIGGTFVIKAITQNPYEEPSEPETTFPVTTAPTTAPATAPVTTTPATAPVTVPVTTTPTTAPVTSSPVTSSPATSVPGTTFPEFDPPVMYVVGDADMNAKVNVKDATLIQKHTASLVILSGADYMAADANRDNYINVKDATAVQKFVADIEFENSIGTIVCYFE